MSTRRPAHFAYSGIEVVERELREAAERQLAGAPGVGDLRRELVSAASAARGLVAFAEREEACLLVVGASHRGAVGEALLGTVGRSVLHGASCPVAIAARGYARRAPERLCVIRVGFDGSRGSERRSTRRSRWPTRSARGSGWSRWVGARLRLVAVGRREAPAGRGGSLR